MSGQPWSVRDGGLGWNSDWMSAGWLAAELSGEDEGRISEDDVKTLLGLVAIGEQAMREAS